jgi:phytoene/squalene synthetase
MRLMSHLALLVLALGAVGCRTYELYPKVTSQRGLVPADQFAAYGHEQAEEVAIGREFAAAYRGESPEALAQQTAAAVAYARKLPEVVDVVPDTLGHRLTVRFKSGWRAAVLPIPDGKRGADTPGVSAATGAGSAK